MNSINLVSTAPAKPAFAMAKPPAGAAKRADNPALRKAFDEFVGETFYGQMLKEMRKSQGKVAYFGGGQAEEIFTQQTRPGPDQKNDRRRRRQAQRTALQSFHSSTKVGPFCRKGLLLVNKPTNVEARCGR